MKKLSNLELLDLLGGTAVTREEYCATLDMLITENWDVGSRCERRSNARME